MSMNKKIFLGQWTHSFSYNSFSFKMASKNRLFPVWGLHLGYTRGGIYTWWGIHVGGKGVLFFATGKTNKN